MTSDNSLTARTRAEQRFEMLQKRARRTEGARTQYEADMQAVRNRTAQLRALRQAKEAADRQAQAPATSAGKRKVPHAR